MNRKKALRTVMVLFSAVFIFFNFSFNSSDEAKIKDSVNKGIDFLKRIQRADGAICDTANSLFDVWETVAATDAIYSYHKDTNDIAFKKAMNFLRTNENEKGLICHNQKCKQAYCLETSAAYFLLLIKTGQLELVKKRIPFILELQKTSGEWEIGNPDVREQKTFPSVTSFILLLLNEANSKAIFGKEAQLFLSKSQNESGHFGAAWEYYGCPAYALWPFRSINTNDKALKLIQDKSSYYIETFLTDPNQFAYKAEVDGCSPELQTALLLSAMTNFKSKKNKNTILKAIHFLVGHQQPQGYWDGGNFPINSKRYVKKEYVFATARSISVLVDHLNSGKK